jgi:hypothetical protein
MKKLSYQEKLELIRKTKQRITKMHDEIDVVFAKMMKRLGFPEGYQRWLFDHVYNDFKTAKEALARDEEYLRESRK